MRGFCHCCRRVWIMVRSLLRLRVLRFYVLHLLLRLRLYVLHLLLRLHELFFNPGKKLFGIYVSYLT